MILLASSSSELLYAWKQGLEGIAAVTTVSDLDALTVVMARTKPEILLLDLDLAALDGANGTARVMKLNSVTKIIALGGEPCDIKELGLFRIGVRGCCRNDINPHLLPSVVVAIQQGELWIRRTLTPRLLDELGARIHADSEGRCSATARLADLAGLKALSGVKEVHRKIATLDLAKDFMNRTTVWPSLALACAVAASYPAGATTLRDAVEQAVRTNPAVLAATNHRFAADAGVKQAHAGYFPRIDLDAGTGRERFDIPDSRLRGLNETTFQQRDATMTLSQMLFDGFAVRSEVARQTARVDSSAYGVAATAEALALRTVSTYLEVLRRQETIDEAVDNLEAHQRIYKQIRMLSESGVGRRADLDQAESRLALAKANLRQEQSSLRDAEVTFQRLVGAPPQALQIPASPDKALSMSEALDAAITGHPSVKSAEADVALASASNSGAKAALSPRIDLELAKRRADDIVRGSTSDLSIMLRLRYNFSRGGADAARISETGFQIQEANEVLNRTRRQVEEDVALAYNANVTARERLDLLRQYVDASAATRESYAKQFSIGQRTLLDLLNAENEYFNARLAYTTGQYTKLASAFRIFAGMGKLLSQLRIALPIDAVKVSGRNRRQ